MYAVTGHRPERLGISYSERDRRVLTRFAIQTLGTYCDLDDTLITGMALGWDQACAEAARSLGMRYIAAIPFEGQESTWPEEAQRRYGRLLASADLIVTISTRANISSAFKARNVYMVDRAETIIALYDGTARGGTFHAVTYAKTQGRRVINVWKDWQAFFGGQRHTSNSV